MAMNINPGWNPPKTTDIREADAFLTGIENDRLGLAVHLDFAREGFYDLYGHVAETEEDDAIVIEWAFEQAYYAWLER